MKYINPAALVPRLGALLPPGPDGYRDSYADARSRAGADLLVVTLHNGLFPAAEIIPDEAEWRFRYAAYARGEFLDFTAYRVNQAALEAAGGRVDL